MSENFGDQVLGILVVDDERPARAKVIRLLGDDPRFRVLGEARDGVEALEQIERLRPDILVLDIQMPGLNGFEMLDALNDEYCLSVVFSTASDSDALRAFEAHAVDYLLKPYDAARFAQALEKAYRLRVGAELQKDRSLLRSALGEYRAQIVLRTVAGGWVQLATSDILRVHADNKHVLVVTVAETYMIRQPLRELAARLDARFVRVHRSDIVNTSHVVKIDPWDHGDALVTLTNGCSLVVTRTYRKTLMTQLART